MPAGEFNHIPQIGLQLRRNASTAVRKALADIEKLAKQKARVDTGAMRDEIHQEPASLGPMDTVGEVVSSKEYGPYNEFGTVHMSAQPYMTPAGEEVKPQFMAAMRQLGKGVR